MMGDVDLKAISPKNTFIDKWLAFTKTIRLTFVLFAKCVVPANTNTKNGLVFGG